MTLTLDRKQARAVAQGILEALEEDATEVLLIDDPRLDMVRVHARGRVVKSVRREREVRS